MAPEGPTRKRLRSRPTAGAGKKAGTAGRKRAKTAPAAPRQPTVTTTPANQPQHDHGDHDEKTAAKKARKQSAAQFAKLQTQARTITQASATEQADWLYGNYASYKQASSLERSGLTDTAIVRSREGRTLSEQLRNCAPVLSQVTDGPRRPSGSPSALVVAQSAITASAYIRHFASHHKECRIAKLFAKHFKEEEQTKYLEEHTVKIATGTPNRLRKLAEKGTLRLGALHLLILDIEVDAKGRTLVSNPEVAADFWRFYTDHVQSRVEKGLTKIWITKGG